MREPILLIPETRRQHGTGHLHRCADLASRLEAPVEILLPTLSTEESRGRDEIVAIVGLERLGATVPLVESIKGGYRAILIDCRDASVEFVQTCRSFSPLVVGLDLSGPGRAYCSYLIDALGVPDSDGASNLRDPSLAAPPVTARSSWPGTCTRALIAFGGSGGGNRAVELADAMSRLLPQIEWTALTDASLPPDAEGARIVYREPEAGLRESLHHYDLVITHYGVTALEALSARVPVVLANPSTYHDELGRRLGLTLAGDPHAICEELERFEAVIERSARARPSPSVSLAALIDSLDPGSAPRESECGPPGPAIARFKDRTYFRSSQTSLIRMQRFSASGIAYGRAYFFEDYRLQYGRDYLDDFDHIRALGRRRLDDLERVSRSQLSSLRLLDIGCAFGPFLAAAAERGIAATGIDVSQEAVAYAAALAGVNAHVADVRDLPESPAGGIYDLVTMWYVIEHFDDIETVLSRVRGSVRLGGLFAFSTPHAAGVSGRRDLHQFLEHSPADHFTIWTPGSARAVLPRFGFRVRRIRITGHHPERFPAIDGERNPRRGLLWKLIEAWSHVRGLGDTFEVIAERVS